MTTGEALDRGRESYGRQQWTDAYAELSAAGREATLDPEDLDRLATTAYLTGKDAESTDLWSRAHQEFLARNDRPRAARSALWLAFGMIARGEMAPAGGWLARAARALEPAGDCAEKGMLLALNAIPIMFGGNPAAAAATFEQAAAIGERFGDRDVVTLARMGQGDSLIRMGESAAGMKLLDEVMAGVTAGEVSPLLTGLVYCALISACNATFDLRRAKEWTAALTRWCESQSGLVAYRGVCLVHRAEILQLRGAWPSAVDEVRQACERLSQPPGHASVGVAYYVRGDLHRLRGEFDEAEEAYRQASQLGRKPDPGLALLWFAQGQVDVAAAAIRRVFEEATERRVRSRILPAYVEILLAAGDVASARKGADELSEIAAALDAPLIRALSAEAEGAVLLAEGNARGALGVLRRAATAWRELDVPYEAARVHLLVGLGCRQLGDEETAKMELDAARRIFQDLGAAADVARAEEVARTATVRTAPSVSRVSVTLGPGSRLGPYEIISSVGAGGMGEVFRARDTRLGRDVAVKILPAIHAADPESVRRFEKEARAVASLSHPNVVPLFDVGEQDGIRYAVAEFVAGETLRARISRGQLPPTEASELAAQIAEGLAAAHQNGLVHRDIKPENVILARPGFARILDFGLAKRNAAMIGTSASDEEATQSALMTAPGVIAGTVGYMSPEQVRGEPVDGRSDIFSLGVVLWEMLTGRRPFRGESPVETLSAILREEPPPDPTFAGLPPEFERIVRRSLEKRPEDRYHSAADLAHDLRSAVASSATLSHPRMTVSTAQPGRGRATLWGGLALLALILAALVAVPRFRRGAASTGGLPRTLAVLPFRGMTSEPSLEHFGLGLADSLIGRLATVRELTVRPTSAIARYETSSARAAEAGRELGVDAVIEGTYQKLEGVTRVSVQMTDVGRAAILWSDRIDLPEGKLFELQDAISSRIVDKLELRLEAQEKRALTSSQAVPDRAMEEYLSARALLRDVSNVTPERRVEIVAAFDRIVSEQPGFARAIGARAYARAWLAFVVPSRENHEAALADAERALSLDPELAEARVARASVAWSSLGGWDVVKAVKDLTAAISRAPNLEIAHLDLARIVYHSGWPGEARREIGEALRLHPFGEAQRMAASATTWLEGAAIGLPELRRLSPEMQRSWAARWQLLWARAVVEDPARVRPDAEALFREAPRSEPAFAAVLAIVRARSGQPTADLEQRIAEADRRAGHFHHVLHFLADVRAIEGDAAASVELLREASKTGLPCGPCFEMDPMLAPIRSSPEYAALKGELARRNAELRAALKDVL